MTTHRRTAQGLTAISALLAAAALYAAYQGHWLPAGAIAYTTVLLTWCASRERARHQRTRAEREHARQSGAHPFASPAPLDPCCLLWHHSAAVHNPQCTRPVTARPALHEANATRHRAA
ncbi:hypothetical protein [Streptomyces sp. NPDC002490]|uniref:hypothetical protein n=1 Tax=Streptomyces sp. NPDC002490 TaxID=3154416 RepID=UPI00332841BD